MCKCCLITVNLNVSRVSMALANIHLTDLRLNLIVSGSFLSPQLLYACRVFILSVVACVCRTMLHRLMQSCATWFWVYLLYASANFIKNNIWIVLFHQTCIYFILLCVYAWPAVENMCMPTFPTFESLIFIAKNVYGFHIRDEIRVVMKIIYLLHIAFAIFPSEFSHTDHSSNQYTWYITFLMSKVCKLLSILLTRGC